MGRETDNRIDRLFNNQLQEASIAPPTGLWNTINAELENDRLRRKVIYWRSVAAATILLFLGVGLWTANHFSSVDHQDHPAQLTATNDDARHSPVGQDRFAFAPQQEMPCATTERSNSTGENIATVANRKAVSSPFAALRTTVRENGKSTLNLIKKSTTDLPKKSGLLLNRTSDEMATRDLIFLSSAQLNPSARHALPDRPQATSLDEEMNDLGPEIVAWQEGNDDAKDKKKMRWALGGAFSPDVAFSTQTPVQPAAARTAAPTLPDDPANSSRSLSAPVATFSTGMRAAVAVNERMSIRTGILYSRRNTSKTIRSNSFGQEDSYANNFSVDFLEIPISLQYNLVHGEQFDYYVSTGVSGNLLMGYEQELQTSTGRVASKNVSDQNQVFSPAQANLLLSTGIQYRAFDRMSFNVEPGLRYGFLTSEYVFARQDPVSLSLMSGVNFHF